MNTIMSTAGMMITSLFLSIHTNAATPLLPPPPDIAPANPGMIDPIDGILSTGQGETVLLHQCFNFVDGAITACYHQHADFKYTYSSVSGANILPRHDLRFGESRTTMPSLEMCLAAEMYDLNLQLPLPAESSTGRFYCFETEYNGDRVYGWFQPTSFNNGGLTFNYLTFQAADDILTHEADPALNISSFYSVHETWRTILDGECFDISAGEVVSCWGGGPDFRYNFVETYGGIVESRPAASYSAAVTTRPTASTCQQSTFLEEVAVTFDSNPPGIYVCFQTEMDGENVYGWLHPTRFNEGGMTFDYVIFTP